MNQDMTSSAAHQICASQAADTLKLLEQIDPIRGEKTATDERLPYRHANLLLLISHPGGGFGRCFSHSRYLTPTRLSVLTKVFMHVGSRIRAYLPDKMGVPEEHECTVVQCKYVCNSIHEVLIMLRDRVNLRHYVDVPGHYKNEELASLAPENIAGRAIIYSDEEADIRLIRHYLRQTRVQISAMDSLGVALDHVRGEPFDAFVCGDVVQGIRNTEIYASLRSFGYSGSFATICPSVGAKFVIGDDTSNMFHLTKPLDASGVINCFSEMLGVQAGGDCDLLHSTLPQDSSNAELVEWYIDHVKCLAHALQKALSANAVEDAKRYMATLRDTGVSYGFDPISETAGEILEKIVASGSIAQCETEVQECINLTRRMRRMK